MDRRDFLKKTALGTGLIIGFHIPVKNALAQLGAPLPTSFPPNAFVHIAPDDSITVISKHTEMGQGIYTGLATILADELDADWSRVNVESAPANVELYIHFMLGMQGTGGSMSIPNSWIQYRTVGATARAMLVTAAAQAWKVPEGELSVSNSVISHGASGRQATFGEFAEAAASLQPPENVPLKNPDRFDLIGTSVAKVDSRDKVTGKAAYTIDVRRPGMLVAVVAHAPRFGARLASFDDTETRKIPGIVDVVQIPRGVAVLAKNTFTAIRGRDVLATEWDYSDAEMRGSDEIMRDFIALAEQPGDQVEVEGDSAAALASAAKTIEATYEFPFLAHAPMEPLDCTIEMVDDRCILRSGTQNQTGDQQRVAEYLGLPVDKVEIETLYAGGGFGRRGNFVPDMAVEAASILKATGAQYPVKLQYTREDDMGGGFYRPMNVHRMRIGLDGLGNISAWENRVVGQSLIANTPLRFMMQNGVDLMSIEGAAELPYAVPNVTVETRMAESGVPVLFWRSVGHTHTQFSKETMMDEALLAAGKDPVQGRLDLMSDERSKAVIRQLAERAGWGAASVPAGRARGFAFTEAFSGRVAQIAEISLDGAGRIKVEKVFCVVDIGRPINPHIIEAQVESAVMFGLSAALYGRIKIDEGRVQTSNFHNYPVIRMNQAPEFDVYIMPSTEAPTGIGEPATPGIAPAVANAYFQLTGKRIRRLPFEGVA